DRYFQIARNLDIFATLFREVTALYVDDVNPNTLIRTAIAAMLESLAPYTNHIPEAEAAGFRTRNACPCGGMGAVTRGIGNRTVVSMIMEGFAAQLGGLKIGDEIVKIDNIPLSELTRDEASQLMKGQVGTPLHLTVKRFGEKDLIELTFQRQKV